jgi:hypothetical protein
VRFLVTINMASKLVILVFLVGFAAGFLLAVGV